MEHRDFLAWEDALSYAVRLYVLCGVHLSVHWGHHGPCWSACWPDRLPTSWGDDHD